MKPIRAERRRGRVFRPRARPRPQIAALAFLLALVTCDSPTEYRTDVAGAFRPVPDGAEFIVPMPPVPSVPGADGGVVIVNSDVTGGRLLRFDTEGDNLDVHEGEIERFGDRFYFYGGSYDCGFHLGVAGSPFCGFKVYSSPDLTRWTDHGYLFDGSTDVWQRRCNGSQFGCYRPHVAFNPRTGRYVLWINTYEIRVGFRVFESESPTGPFEERPPPSLAEMASPQTRNGDESLFVDDDGTGYIAYTDWRHDGDLIVEELTPDLLSGTGRHVRLGLARVEAPSIFKRAGRYYLTFGDPNCGYCGTGGSFMTASHPLGPWSAKKRFIEPCGGQPSDVAMLPTVTGDTLYLYQGDRWNDLEKNQATAAHFWAPLDFEEDGDIAPVDCAASFVAPLDVRNRASASEAAASRMRVTCDVGRGAGERNVEREVRFPGPATGGRLRGLAFPVFRKGTPGAPLRVEVRRGDAVVHAVSVSAEHLSFSARRRFIPTELALEPGESYAVRFSAAETSGCYGLAWYASAPTAQPHRLFVRESSAADWTEAANEALRLDLWIDPSR